MSWLKSVVARKNRDVEETWKRSTPATPPRPLRSSPESSESRTSSTDSQSRSPSHTLLSDTSTETKSPNISPNTSNSVLLYQPHPGYAGQQQFVSRTSIPLASSTDKLFGAHDFSTTLDLHADALRILQQAIVEKCNEDGREEAVAMKKAFQLYLREISFTAGQARETTIPPSFQDILLESSFGGKAQRHEHVNVLCITWKDDNSHHYADQMGTFIADNDGPRTLLIICYLGATDTVTSTTAPRTLHLRPSANCAAYLKWNVGTLHKYSADILVVMSGGISACDCAPLAELTAEDLATSCFRHAIEVLKLPRSPESVPSTAQPLHQAAAVLTTLGKEKSPAFPIKQLIDDIYREIEKITTPYGIVEVAEVSTTKLCIGPDIWLAPSKPIFSLEHQQMSFDDGYIFDSRDLIHEDGFTEVYKVVLNLRVRKTVVPTVCAIKRFRPRHKRQQAEARRIFLRERQNLIRISQWKHPRIMGMLGSFEVTTILNFKFGHLDLIFSFADGGDLGAFMRLPSLRAVLGILHPENQESESEWTGCSKAIMNEIAGLSEALEFIHGKSRDKTPGFAIHRDIKPSNILIHEARFKFADFGLSKFKSGESTSKIDWWAGTPMYAPPEKKDEEYMHGRARDVWALGCVFLELVVMVDSFRYTDTVTTPAVDLFENERLNSSGTEEVAAFAKTIPCVVRWIESLAFGSVATGDGKESKESIIISVVRKMLEPDPTRRAKANEIAKKLQNRC